jgi:hypothetical protein
MSDAAAPLYTVRVDQFTLVTTEGVQRCARLTTTVPDPYDPERTVETTILLDQPAVEQLIANLQEIDW